MNNNEVFEVLKSIISNRRTTKAAAMNGEKINREDIEKLLELANWAPTHGRTEPWRFIVFENDALKQFGVTHSELYLQNIAPEKLNADSADKLLHAVDKASHLLLVYMKRGENPKISTLEEIAATSAAVQNVLLGAQALGIAAIWNTGGMAHHHSLKNYFHLAEEDVVMGLIYLGYSDDLPKEGTRKTSSESKTTWFNQ